VETEVKALLEGALAAAAAVVTANRALHSELSEQLAADERLDGAPLAAALEGVQVVGGAGGRGGGWEARTPERGFWWLLGCLAWALHPSST
jgi:hypothetical protein